MSRAAGTTIWISFGWVGPVGSDHHSAERRSQNVTVAYADDRRDEAFGVTTQVVWMDHARRRDLAKFESLARGGVDDTIRDSPAKKVSKVGGPPSFRSCQFSYPGELKKWMLERFPFRLTVS